MKRSFRGGRLRWEFWPIWAVYLPLVPYLIYLALKHRSATVFLAANPGMDGGGFVGESKSEILRQLDPAAVAPFALVENAAQALLWIESFPAVLKPDVGERGKGVAVIRNEDDVHNYFAQTAGKSIVQRYVAGVEFGIFYCRMPDEAKGRILSITDKRFPEVIGDGTRTLAELILSDPRAMCLASVYMRQSKRPLNDTPRAGERVQLVEIGSHSRGSIFLDGMTCHTPELEDRIDQLSKSHPGFYFGRYDVRAPSEERIAEFTVLELNGVSAEATHIYDPAVSLREAYRVLAQQWRLAFEIGAQNRLRGAVVPPAAEVWQSLRSGEVIRAQEA